MALERCILEKTQIVSGLRLARGRLAALLLSKRSWVALGYARIGDYSRERFGIAGRTLEDDARVSRALDALPHVLAAFEQSRLSWTKVRLLASVADRSSELDWIEIALCCDTKSLEQRIRGNQDPVEAVLCDDAQRVRFSVSISHGGRRLWRAACELAERTAGSALTQAQVLELITAEAASGAPRPFARAVPDAHVDMPAPSSGAASVPAKRFPAAAEAVTDDETADPFTLDARLRDVERTMHELDSELGCFLLLALERRLHRRSGFGRFSDYVEERLDFCARKAWTLIAIERASRRSKELASAYREGRISYLAATALLPVMTSRHAAAWVERAGEITLRRLEDEVAWALDQRDAGHADDDSFEIPAPPSPDRNVHCEKLSALDRERVQIRALGEPVEIGNPVELILFVPPEVASLAEDVMLAIRRGAESRGSAFERMVAAALHEWLSAPKHRDPVFERDGWRCAVPGCRSRRNLHDHHVVFRSKGGTDARDNRITVCASHHLHGLHTGRIRAIGRAPGEIVWKMPLGQRLLGDRYL